jgi:hypothetical protein
MTLGKTWHDTDETMTRAQTTSLLTEDAFSLWSQLRTEIEATRSLGTACGMIMKTHAKRRDASRHDAAKIPPG